MLFEINWLIAPQNLHECRVYLNFYVQLLSGIRLKADSSRKVTINDLNISGEMYLNMYPDFIP
jgi:hypothetical protein